MSALSAKVKSYRLAVAIVILALLTSHQPLNAQTSGNASNQPILYRGDQHRAGFVKTAGVPKFTQVAWQKTIGEAVSHRPYMPMTPFISALTAVKCWPWMQKLVTSAGCSNQLG